MIRKPNEIAALRNFKLPGAMIKKKKTGRDFERSTTLSTKASCIKGNKN